MATQIRDTQFGHFARFLSRATIFKYPDELNLSLYNGSDHQLASSAASENDPTSEEAGEDNERLGDESEKRPDIDCLVDWYGPSDPEVQPFSPPSNH
jgi:hypothetical protein